MTEQREFRVFVASPDDVSLERSRIGHVVAKLNTEFSAAARFVAILWEQEFYRANKTFQVQIPEPSECDVVIVIFGNKLGTELPETFEKRLPDGRLYPSGTAYELLSSIAAADANNRPDVYVFRTTREPKFSPGQGSHFDAARREQARLDGFFEQWFRTPDGNFLRAFHTFASTDEFEDRAEALLRKWVGTSLEFRPVWDVRRDGSPFRGLQPFDARHSRVFFGRNRKVQRATDALIAASEREQGRRFLLVVGPSGSGKSSLVRAGVIPRLTAPGFVRQVDVWRVAVMRPGGGDTPVDALAKALYASGDTDTDSGGFGAALPELAQGQFATPEQLAAEMQASPSSAGAPVTAALNAIAQAQRAEGGFSRPVQVDLLLLVDQLEELFADSVANEQRITFARLLMALADSRRVWIIATLRADLYAHILDQKSPFLALKDSGGSYDLASPGGAELREILEKSAEAADLVYDTDPNSGESLDELLLRDATGTDMLPLLQFSLQVLFDEKGPVQTPQGEKSGLTFAAYKALGGLDGAINKVAEEAIRDPGNGLGNDDIHDALQRLVLRTAELVRSDRGATAAQAPLTARAVTWAEATREASSRALVEVLVHKRLLVVATGTDSAPTVRLSHERVLTSWKAARDVLDELRPILRVKADVEPEASRWKDNNRLDDDLLLTGERLQEVEGIIGKSDGVVREFYRDLHDYVVGCRTRRDHQAILVELEKKRKKRFFRLSVSAIAGVTAVAAGFALFAYISQQKAAGTFSAAKNAGGNLVTAAHQLRNQKGLDSQTVDTVFDVTEKLIVQLQQQTPGKEYAGALDRIQSDMFYEFAEAYHQSANGAAKAHKMAQDGLAIRQHLLAAGDTTPLARGSIAMSQMQLGDLLRIEIEQAQPGPAGPTARPPDFSPARALFQPALQTLEQLFVTFPQDARWARGYTWVLTRVGDLDRKSGDVVSASARYARAKMVSVQEFRLAPDDSEALHEIVWSFRKAGEIETDLHDFTTAVRSYSDEVCIHRHLLEQNPNDLNLNKDVGFGLMMLGGAFRRLQPPDLAGARTADYEAAVDWRKIVEQDTSKKMHFTKFADSLEALGDVLAATDDAEMGGIFRAAAGDMRRQTGEAFHDENKLPADQAQRTLIVREENRLRQNGAMAMIEPHRRWAIDNALHDVETQLLPEVKRRSEGCWERLLQTVTTAAAQPTGNPSRLARGPAPPPDASHPR